MKLDVIQFANLLEAANDPRYGLNLSLETHETRLEPSDIRDNAHSFRLNTHHTVMKLVKRMNDKPDTIIYTDFAKLLVFLVNNASLLLEAAVKQNEQQIIEAEQHDKIKASEFVSLCEKYKINLSE